MYEIAVRQGDRATADRYSAILEKSAMRSTYLQLRTVELFYQGRWRESQQASASLVELLEQQGLPERAALILSNQAVGAANIGDLAAARQYAEAAEKMTNANPAGQSVDFNVNLAVAYAGLGEVGRARKYFGNITARDVPDGELRDLITQIFEGLFAVKSGNPARALERLASLAADGKHPLLVNGFYVRAHANAALERWADAERDFRAVLDRKPNRQYNIAGPLAELGLARALARQGKKSEARDAYQKFLDGWSKADPDLKELKAAKAEVAALGT
jgi:tetratricopeptide (TPR) repeat protein